MISKFYKACGDRLKRLNALYLRVNFPTKVSMMHYLLMSNLFASKVRRIVLLLARTGEHEFVASHQIHRIFEDCFRQVFTAATTTLKNLYNTSLLSPLFKTLAEQISVRVVTACVLHFNSIAWLVDGGRWFEQTSNIRHCLCLMYLPCF